MCDSQMNIEEESSDDPLSRASLLYYSTRLEECIAFVQNNKTAHAHLPIQTRQELQMYEGLALMESARMAEGHKCFKDLSDWAKAEKSLDGIGDEESRIDTIDLIIECLYLWEIFYENEIAVYPLLPHLKSICNAYKITKESTQEFNEGIYLFGIGLHIFLDQFDPYSDDSTMIPTVSNEIEILESALHKTTIFTFDIVAVLGWIAFRSGKSENALIYYHRIHDQNPAFPGIKNNIAIALMQLNRFEEAEKFFNGALLLAPRNQLVLCNIATLYSLKEGNEKKAEEYMKEAIEIDPTSVIALYTKAEIFVKFNQLEDAETVCRTGLEIDPDNNCINYLLGKLEWNKGNSTECKERYLHLLQTFPYVPHFNYELGELMFQEEEFEEAIIYYRAYIKQKLEKGKNASNCYGVADSSVGLVYSQLNLGQWLDCLKTAIEFISNVKGNSPVIEQIENAIIEVLRVETPLVGIYEKLLLFLNRDSFVMSKFSSFAERITEVPLARMFFLQLIEEFEQIITLIPYKRECAQYLGFQNNVQHWDLYLK